MAPGARLPKVAGHSPSGLVDHARVAAWRALLLRHGYDVAAHGKNEGSTMRSAVSAYRRGVGSGTWNHNHPVAVEMSQLRGDHFGQPQVASHAHAGPADTPAHPNAGANRPHGPAGGPHPKPSGPAPHLGRGNGGGGGAPDFTGMLTGLLGQSDTAQAIPKSLADKIAGVDTATAAGFQDQLNHLPAAKKAALANIADWFGQVSGAEGKAASNDQSMAQAGSAAMQDAAKGIMDSLGGSAMAGSGQIGAVGANDANTLAAIGANDKMLSSDLAPIFKLQEANAKNARSQQYDQAQSGLENSLAQAQGQAETDRANALMQILGANNSARQTNFSNQSGLLNTLASLQISGMNAQSNAQYKAIENALHMSDIRKNMSKSSGGLNAMTPQERADFVQKIVAGLVDPNSHKLSMSWPDALRAARNSTRSAGLNPMNKAVIQTIIGPALSNAGITGPGGGYWPAIYQP